MIRIHKEYATVYMLLLLVGSITSCVHGMKREVSSVVSFDTSSLLAGVVEAACNNDLQTLQMLLAQGKKSSCGHDPLGWAAHHGNVESAQLLLQRGFKLQVAEDGSTPLHTAAYHNKLAVLTLLLTHPYHLPWVSEAKARTNQSGLEIVTKELAKIHFDRLRELLTLKTVINGIPMTAYDAAGEKSENGHDSSCRELLKPDDLQTKLCNNVEENYKRGLIGLLKQ